VGQILTIKELAEYLKMREEAILKYVKAGKIPARMVGSGLRFDKDQIDELLINKVAELVEW
jgi:excisionase family DNA binding protein